jgi:hypothetical protein
MVIGSIDRLSSRPVAAALAGLLCVLPFAVLDAIVANRVEPFITLLRPDTHTSTREIVLFTFVLLLLPLGAFVALRPLLRKDPAGKRRFFLMNCAAALLLALFSVLTFALGSEIYACEVLQIPNCD